MADTQQQQTAPAPQLKTSSSSPAPQLSAARKVARKARAMADSLEAGGASAGEEMVSGGTDKAAAAQAPAKSGTPAAIAEEGFAGTPVALPHLAKMEASFGRSFATVKAYTDTHAVKASQALGANAYTVGDRIAFATPNPSAELVAHELTHVVQNTGGSRVQTSGGEGEGIETGGEAEAENVEAAVASGKPARSAMDGVTGDATAAAGGEKKAGGPSLKAKGPALDSKFGMGMTFSTEAIEKTYQYELWKAPPFEVPIPAVPGLNFMVEPSVIVKVYGAANWKEKNVSVGLGVEGNVGVGFSYGNSQIASIYGVMEAKASGGFEYKKSDTEWSLDGAIGMSTNFKVGCKLGGVLDYGFEFGKCEIGKLTGLSWKNGKFNRAGIGWAWGPKPKEFFGAIKAGIDKAKRLAAAGAAVADAAYNAAANTGTAIYNGGAAAVNWVTSW